MEKSSMNMKSKKKSVGLSLIGWAVAIPFTFILLLIFTIGFYEGRKAFWDYKVTKMCEADGGATVFENVKITQEEYERLGGINGTIPVSPEKYKKDSPYFDRTVSEKIHEWNPEVIKRTTEIIRSADEKVLGKQITFSRIGGDTPTGIGHPSSFSCRDVEGIKLRIVRLIFTVVNGDTR